MMIITYACIVVPTTMFIAYIAPHVGIGWAILGVVSGGWAFTSFSLAALNDPGILPRASDPGVGIADAEDADLVQRSPEEQRFCRECNILQPRDSFHCTDCGVCIAELDHHCVWTGRCIGRDNLRWFYMFLVSIATMMITLMLLTLGSSGDEKSN